MKPAMPPFETPQFFYAFVCGAVFAAGLLSALVTHSEYPAEAWWDPGYLLAILMAIVATFAYQGVKRAFEREIVEYQTRLQFALGTSVNDEDTV
jgi:drug/metabolite transporter (DMT)-like permease